MQKYYARLRDDWRGGIGCVLHEIAGCMRDRLKRDEDRWEVSIGLWTCRLAVVGLRFLFGSTVNDVLDTMLISAV